MRHLFVRSGLVAGITFVMSGSSWAAETESPAPSLSDALVAVDTVWVLLAAFLVFFMQAGFGMVEAGLIRAKNTCNILMKNWLDYCVASIMFFLIGYGLMFGEGNGLIGWNGFAMKDATNPSGVPIWAFWLFQAAFCGAAATIVAGGMAERMKFPAYLAYTAVVSALVYPIIGHWVWGGGWLSKMGFFDFAGSTVVHSTGGWIALVGTMMLGPRAGKFIQVNGNSRIAAIPGHNIPMATLGVFLLWFGWFGFNPGSTLGVSTEGLRNSAALVATNTNLAAAAGLVMAMIMVWISYGRTDLSITMNGALAGLVAITAPCAVVSPMASILIGGIAGILVVLGVKILDLLHIDDPVGAVPVHGMNGLWGTLAVGLWGQKELGLANDGLFHGGGFSQLGVQTLGCVSGSLFAMISMAIVFSLIQMTIGLRVSREEELRGLDIEEHGLEAYAGFQIFITQ